MIIDPKPENWALYPSGVLLMTPNESENRQMRFVQPELPQHILVTKGKKGMTLHTDQWSKDIESKDVPNCEVIGAGDTVSATMAISLSRGVDIVRAAKISNACAGYVVSQPSTAVVPKEVYEDIFIKESL
jgi:bifunctional ADP-heptose synthase (sugar kinase/adenylyltransferase)